MIAPLLSIVIVVRNDTNGLRRTLNSITRHSQALEELPGELLIVDGASNDGSLEVAQAFTSNKTLPTRVLQQPPQGIYPAMNLGWRQARGTWLMFVNAGDLLFQAQPLVSALQHVDPAVCALQGRSAMQLPGLSWGFEVLSEAVRCHQALVYRKELHQRVGPYDERLKVCADTAFMEQIPAGQLALIPDLVAVSSVSPKDTSRTPNAIRRDLRTLRTTHPSFRPWPTPKISLLILQLEKLLGVSWSVWIRAALGVLRGTHRLVHLD